MQEQYKWRAHYGSGQVINQGDADYEQLERNDLLRFDIVEGDRIAASVICDDKPELLFWRRRVYKDLATGTDSVCHLLGKKGEFVLLLFPDGSVMARHNFVADDVYFDEPQKVGGEAWA